MMDTRYEFEERCLCTLRFAPQMLLWSMRYWVRSYRNNECPLPFLRKGFHQNGIRGAAEAMDRLMLVVSATSRCTIDLRCMKYPKLSVDEERLIAVFAEAFERLQGPAHAQTQEFSTVVPFARLSARDEAWPASQAAGWPGTNTVPAGDIGTRARFSHAMEQTDLLSVWLPPTAVAMAQGHAEDVADAFLAAGLKIEQDRNVRPYPIGGETIHGMSEESRTLH